MSHSASESFPPETATSTRSRGPSMSNRLIALRTCSRTTATKHPLQKALLCRRTSMTAGAGHRRHLTGVPLRRSPGGSRSRPGPAADPRRVTSSPSRITSAVSGCDAELEEEVVHGAPTVDLDLAVWVAEPDPHRPRLAHRPSRHGARRTVTRGRTGRAYGRFVGRGRDPSVTSTVRLAPPFVTIWTETCWPGLRPLEDLPEVLGRRDVGPVDAHDDDAFLDPRRLRRGRRTSWRARRRRGPRPG